MDRRIFVASLTAVIGLPRFAVAQRELRGGGTVITVSDGNLVLPRGFIFDPMPQEQLAEVLAPFDLAEDTLTPECNLTMLRRGERTVLFDAGAGPDFQP